MDRLNINNFSGGMIDAIDEESIPENASSIAFIIPPEKLYWLRM